MKSITENKEFWKIIEPFLSEKVTAQSNVSLVEKGKVLSNETKRFFKKNTVYQLGINRNEANDEPALSNNPVDVAIQKFINHRSVKLVRDNINLFDMFKFDSISLANILGEVANLNSANIGTFKDIPLHCRKLVSDIFNHFLAEI